MKKVLMLMPAFALAFALAASADAASVEDDDLSVSSNNNVGVSQSATSMSNSGVNAAFSGRVSTGKAKSLSALEVNVNRNTTDIEDACCFDDVSVSSNNHIGASQNSYAKSNTGVNVATGAVFPVRGYCGMPRIVVRGGVVETGEASSTATGLVMGNTNVTRISD